MVLQDAFTRAQEHLDRHVRPVHDLEILVCSVRELSNHWVFGYNTREFLTERVVRSSLVGNGPVVVRKSDGETWLASSGLPIDAQLGDDV